MLTDQYLYLNNNTTLNSNNELVFDIPKLTNQRVPNVGICLAQSTININQGVVFHRGLVVKLKNPTLNYSSIDNKGSVLGFYKKGPQDDTDTGNIKDTHDLKQPAENITHVISSNISRIVLTFETLTGQEIVDSQYLNGAFLFKFYYPNQGQIEDEYVPQIAKVRL